MNIKFALISDFDGTISKKDFFYMVIEQLLNTNISSLPIWKSYLNKEITHIEAMSKIFSQIHLEQTELDKFISKIEIDDFFYYIAEFCDKNEIPLYICSAGTNYYIRKRLNKILDKYNINLISNDAIYSKENGMKLIAPPKDSIFYDSNTGISKENVVKALKDGGYTTIFVGDGQPDFKSAKIADIVFARGMLFELCIKEKIKVQYFNNFSIILNYLKNIYSLKII